ncbi:MAG TPA: hypothetical protein VFC24_09825 [Casimicrobiaceae bacterium]|nr:hypothetical protein [Casimicrobiaceae bacterium]
MATPSDDLEALQKRVDVLEAGQAAMFRVLEKMADHLTMSHESAGNPQAAAASSERDPSWFIL